jgi:hypothetical protein
VPPGKPLGRLLLLHLAVKFVVTLALHVSSLIQHNFVNDRHPGRRGVDLGVRLTQETGVVPRHQATPERASATTAMCSGLCTASGFVLGVL